ncbi:MAG: PRC-barrel domain-containing protein [Hyphomicrobiales bacterium]
MRTGLVIIAIVAVGLIAAVGAYSDASGRAEQAARSAQARQVAQTPEPSPPPMGQPENPPSTAAPPAPPSNPSPGTPAVVLDDQEVSTILGKSVRSSAAEDMGRIVDIIVSHDGQVRAAIIDFGGFLGIGMRKIAVDWRALNFAPAGKPGSITVDLTRNQVRLAPEYKRGEPVVVVSSASPERATPSSEAAAPER